MLATCRVLHMNGMNELDATGVQFGQPQATQGQPHHVRAGPQRPAGAHWLRRRKGRFLHLFFSSSILTPIWWGPIEFYWVFMRACGVSGVLPFFFQVPIQVPIGFNRDWVIFTGFDWVWLGFTEFYRVFKRACWVSRGFTGCCRFFMSFYWV